MIECNCVKYWRSLYLKSNIILRNILAIMWCFCYTNIYACYNVWLIDWWINCFELWFTPSRQYFYQILAVEIICNDRFWKLDIWIVFKLVLSIRKPESRDPVGSIGISCCFKAWLKVRAYGYYSACYWDFFHSG